MCRLRIVKQHLLVNLVYFNLEKGDTKNNLYKNVWYVFGYKKGETTF